MTITVSAVAIRGATANTGMKRRAAKRTTVMLGASNIDAVLTRTAGRMMPPPDDGKPHRLETVCRVLLIVGLSLVAATTLTLLIILWTHAVQQGNQLRRDTARTCIEQGGSWLNGTSCVFSQRSSN